MKVAPSVLSRIAATKAILEQKFLLPVECVAQGLGKPKVSDDDLTSNVFGSDARVDTLARCVGILASRIDPSRHCQHDRNDQNHNK
jgi:hypothetical protein